MHLSHTQNTFSHLINIKLAAVTLNEIFSTGIISFTTPKNMQNYRKEE